VSGGVFLALVVSFAMSGARTIIGLHGLLLSATKRMLAPLIASIAIAAIICLLFRSRNQIERSANRVVQLIVWLPPLFLLLWQMSAWAVLPACLFGASAVSRLRWKFVRGFPASFVVSALLQWGTVLWIVDREVKATLALALSAVVFSLLARTSKPRTQSWTRTGATVVAAFLLTLVASIPLLLGGGGSASASNGANPSTPPKSKQDPGTKGGPATAAEFVAETHRGVILFPEEERVVRLVPPLPMLGRGLKKMSKTDPLSIPFYGVYWMFREPFKEPPPGSFTLRGDPDLKSFRSGDFVPLQMEAHQNFGKLIDTTCCKQIRVAIRSADRFPSSISVELLLVNTSLAGKPRLSLGRAEVTSTPPFRPGPVPLSVPELLSFDVPPEPSISQFDQVSVIFHRSKLRSYRSARIAIERFILMPR